jgi:signal transduction histidine kinase
MEVYPPAHTTSDQPHSRFGRWAGLSLLFLFLLLPPTAVSVWAYIQQKTHLKQRVLESLELLAYHKRQSISIWHQRCLRDAGEILALPDMQPEALHRAQSPGAQREALLIALDKFSASKGFVAAALADPSGAVLEWSRVGPSEFACTGSTPATTPSPGQPFMGPLRRSSAGSCILEVTVPIQTSAKSDRSIGGVLFAVDPRKTLFWDLYMVSAPQGITGAEMCLAQRRGNQVELVLPANMDKVPPLSAHEPESSASLAWKAARGKIGSGEGRDYRGVPVLYATQFLSGTGWGIIARMDERTAFLAQRESRWFVAGITLLSGLFGLAVLYAWWGRRYNLALSGLLAELHVQKDKLEETVGKLFTAQESERKRLSYDIHDQIIQFLSGIRLHLTALHSKVSKLAPMEVQKELLSIEKDLFDCVQEARAVVARTRPPELDALGLPHAVETLAYQFAPLRITLDIGPPEDFETLPSTTTLALYRTAQEGLANVRKHAEAKTATLSLKREGEEVTLTLTDLGKGFDPSHIEGLWHFGLRSMEERIGLVGGTFTVESALGSPTRITARVPSQGGLRVKSP